MSDCPNLKECPFFNDQLENMTDLTKLTKTIFCKDAYYKCCRYQVAKKSGTENVPSDLFPADYDTLKHILPNKIKKNNKK